MGLRKLTDDEETLDFIGHFFQLYVRGRDNTLPFVDEVQYDDGSVGAVPQRRGATRGARCKAPQA